MTIAELKRQIDEAAASVPPDTEADIALFNGRDIKVGKVYVGVYTNGTRKILIEEAE